MSESDPQSTSREVVKNYTRARKFPQLLGMTPDGKKLPPGGPYSYTQFVGAGLVALVLWKTPGIWATGSLIRNVFVFLALVGVTAWGTRQAPPHRRPKSTVHGRRCEQSTRFASTSAEGRRTYTATTPSPRPRRHGDCGASPVTRGAARRGAHSERSPGPHRVRTCLPHPPSGATASFTAVHSPPAATGHPTRCIHQRPATCCHGRRIAQRSREGLMLQPITAVGGNLRWTRSGTVWADFILTGIEYGYRPAEDKSTARSMHKMLMRALDGEALLLGICASLNPEAVVARMEEGIDLDAHPQWAAECDATIETLEMFQPGKRIYWLSIPLANRGWKNQAAAAWSAARTTLTDYLGLPRTSLDPEEVARRTTQANMIAADIPAYFRPTPATPAQMVWLHQHSLQRGLGLDSDVPLPYASIGTKPMAAFTAARFDEGAQSDRPSSGWKSKAPTLTKALKIDQPWTLEERPANYQCLLALADTPSGNTVFPPGSEFLALADAIAGVDVDWGIRLHIRSSAEVSKKNKRALINLNEQFSQREGEVSHGHGGSPRRSGGPRRVRRKNGRRQHGSRSPVDDDLRHRGTHRRGRTPGCTATRETVRTLQLQAGQPARIPRGPLARTQPWSVHTLNRQRIRSDHHLDRFLRLRSLRPQRLG